MKIEPMTPVIVGVGEVMEPIPKDLNQCSSHADLAAAAARRALQDALNSSLSAAIDAIACVRTFADTSLAYQCPFGGADNFPRAVSQRIGANPDSAVYEVMGGQSPQKLVGEYCEKLANGTHNLVLLAGGEAIANVKAARRGGVELNWSEEVGGQCEDRGVMDEHPIITAAEFKHQVLQPVQFYGLMEQSRRAELEMDQSAYNRSMAELFEPFSAVAAHNPNAMFPHHYSADELIEISDRNPMIAAPYPKRLVAQDGVNQGAALLLTTVGKARELGIDESRWVYLHGYADTKEKVMLERRELHRSLAMDKALLGALNHAGKAVEDIRHLDLYSCFPVVVFEACRTLGIVQGDPRTLTQTGGLPFFGGPGNNYTMHGIASLVETLRADAGSFGLAYGNGGFMSKHSVGVYSTTPCQWRRCSSRALQAQDDGRGGRQVGILVLPVAPTDSRVVLDRQQRDIQCRGLNRSAGSI